ncbi:MULTISPECIES: NAD-dependent epimerase/dehydratase family protein [Sorangium]|uniref:UDP-glucose epimerase n=1 Tax=Sorangium cellulosum TaxID=56 RepID=A0A4P2R164_SORCE|nr:MULTISPECIES: NAD-dependent epimerase/dehydratase family protein [Sorangium]AUX36660.1 UDP-glucose epimerase [Sorangium cellulosum]WCQ95958.1 UDP-N-acetylglucosamine 4-epimerase [Sorangium sp. Soce836]
MRCLVTGVAGFIGAHLAERLIELGHEVLGVDRFTDYYGREIKEGNLARLLGEPRFSLSTADLATADLRSLLSTCEVVFHQAAQAGVRPSWGQSFEGYLRDNVLATQRLLEAARAHGQVRKLVYASSSSVYGDADDVPMHESRRTAPHSPYGVTKLAAENLCELYRRNFGLPTVSLRYFTVYGPGQRPDMAFHRFIAAVLKGETVRVHGDGEQTRDFTYVSDVVQANVEAMEGGAVGVFNIGGGSRVSLNEALRLLGELAGPVRVERGEPQAGDVRHTWADTAAARAALRYVPRVPLREGLAAQVAWQSRRLGPAR